MNPLRIILARLNKLEFKPGSAVTELRLTVKNLCIGFIGAGNMANSLINGLLGQGIEPESIVASDIDNSKTERLRRESGIRTASNQALVDEVDVIVLAVKPQILARLCQDISLHSRRKLVISVAAGITLAKMESWLGSDTAIIRCMPNTPASVGKGVSGMIANANTSKSQRALATDLLTAVGIAVWVDNEREIDAVTAISGSGPAYYFLFLEAMQEAAREIGLPDDTAKILCLQTAIGACELANSSCDSFGELRREVTSPGGTTEQAIMQFESGGLRELVQKAITAACDRSKQLAKG